MPATVRWTEYNSKRTCSFSTREEAEMFAFTIRNNISTRNIHIVND